MLQAEEPEGQGRTRRVEAAGAQEAQEQEMPLCMVATDVKPKRRLLGKVGKLKKSKNVVTGGSRAFIIKPGTVRGLRKRWSPNANRPWPSLEVRDADASIHHAIQAFPW